MTIEKESNLAIDLYLIYVSARAGVIKVDEMKEMETNPSSDNYGALCAVTTYLVAMTDELKGEEIRTIGGLMSVLNRLTGVEV